MLHESIKMNLKISESYFAKAIGWLVFVFLIMDLLTIPALVAAGIYIILAFRDLFDRSLFGEEAYAYMLAPIPMKYVILGKVMAASLWMLLSYMIVWAVLVAGSLLFPDAFGTSFHSVTAAMQDLTGLYDAVENGVIGEAEIVYDRGHLLGIAVALTLAPVRILAFVIFSCGAFQFGAVLKHLRDPRRDNTMAAMGAVLGCLAGYLTVLAAVITLDLWISGDIVTIWTTLLHILIPTAAGVGLLVGSIGLLEKKYSLY